MLLLRKGRGAAALLLLSEEKPLKPGRLLFSINNQIKNHKDWNLNEQQEPMGKEARTRNDSRMIRCCRSEKKESCTFRMTHYVLVTNIFLTFGFALSLLSSMDCFFLKVDVGFKPVNAVYDTSMFGIGLWTFEDPNNLGYCSSNIRKANISDMSFTYSLYSRNWSNGDSAWTGSRIMCSIGTSFGIVALVSSSERNCSCS